MSNRTFKFPALNVQGVGRMELFSKGEDAAVREAKAIYRALCVARFNAGEPVSAMPKATICDRHCKVGELAFPVLTGGDVIYRAIL